MRRIIIFILITISISGYSQSIVNTEKALPDSEHKFFLGSDVTTIYSGGNREINQFNIGLNVGWKIENSNVLRIISGATLLNSGSENIKNVGFSQIRHNFIINNRIKTFTFYQAQYNNILLIKNRQLFGSGIRFDIRKSDTSNFDVALLIGAMYEYEMLNQNDLMVGEIGETDFIRSATSVALKYDIDNIHIVSITYYQTHMLDFSDYRILNDTEVKIDINKNISINFIFQYRYDSKPPDALKPHDYINTIGVSYKIN